MNKRTPINLLFAFIFTMVLTPSFNAQANEFICNNIYSDPNSMASNSVSISTNKPAKTVEVDLGVIQKQNKNGTKLQFTLIKSKYKTAEAIINSLFSKILGGAVNLKKINLVLEKFLKDTSSDPYFVRLARAFDLQIETDYETLAKRIPKDGPTIIVSNHPRNGSDGIALAAAISKVRGNVKVVMNNF